MNDEFNLNRFLIQQNNNKNYDLALKELKVGKKKSNWMFFIFPQIVGLGNSPYDDVYSIKSLKEAKSYLENIILYSHLEELLIIILNNKTNTITDIFSFPDNLKFKSSMTLFSIADPTNTIFQKVLDKYYNGEKDENTINILKKLKYEENNEDEEEDKTKEDYPYVICNMVSSIDGKVTGDFLEENNCNSGLIQFYNYHRNLNADAFCCGKNTMNISFTQDYLPDLSMYKNSHVKIGKDFIYKLSYTHFAVAYDSNGTLGWKNSHIISDDSAFNKAHIIEVLTEKVNTDYLAYLQDIKVSYIFAGKDKIDIKLSLLKLKKLFNINCLCLEGGSLINESFLNEDLIDEINLFIVPMTGGKDSKSLFNNGEMKNFELVKTSLFEGGVVNVNYKKI